MSAYLSVCLQRQLRRLPYSRRAADLSQILGYPHHCPCQRLSLPILALTPRIGRQQKTAHPLVCIIGGLYEIVCYGLFFRTGIPSPHLAGASQVSAFGKDPQPVSTGFLLAAINLYSSWTILLTCQQSARCNPGHCFP